MSDQGEHPDGPDPIRDLVWGEALSALHPQPAPAIPLASGQDAKLSRLVKGRDKDAELTDQVDRDLMLMALGEVLSTFSLTPVDDSKVYQSLVPKGALDQWKMAMEQSLERPRCEFRGVKDSGEVVRCVRGRHNDYRHLMLWA